MAKVLIEAYGCTLNQADSDIMGSMLGRSGYDVEYGRHTRGTKLLGRDDYYRQAAVVDCSAEIGEEVSVRIKDATVACLIAEVA